MPEVSRRHVSRRGAALLVAILLSGILLAGGLIILLVLGSGSSPGRVIGGLAIILGWILLAATAVALPATGYRSTARSLLRRHEEVLDEVSAQGEATGDAIQQVEKSLASVVKASQTAVSKEQQRQRRSLDRIESALKSLAVAVPPVLPADRSGGIDVLFVTSNGAGLGHLSRLMAIANKLPDGRRVEILTLSKAYEQAASLGFTVHYFPSAEAAGQPARDWNASLRDRVRELIVASRPAVVVFDGTWVYAGLSEACRALRIPLVWVQRGMWRPEVDATAHQRHHASEVAQMVIVPGDFAGEEKVDAGDGVAIHHVDPIVMTEPRDLLDRTGACRKLGLDPDRRYVLVNLGGGILTDPDAAASSSLRALRELAPDLVPVQVVSPLAAASDPLPGVVRVVAYPVMPCARAFEFQIAAAGYNASQEAVALALPTILVPNARTRTDDQVRRAQLLAEQGLVRCALNSADMESAIAEFAGEGPAIHLRGLLGELPAPAGADQAALLLDGVIAGAQWTGSARTVHGAQDGGQE